MVALVVVLEVAENNDVYNVMYISRLRECSCYGCAHLCIYVYVATYVRMYERVHLCYVSIYLYVSICIQAFPYAYMLCISCMHTWWSTHSHLSGIITYGLEGHFGSPSMGALK